MLINSDTPILITTMVEDVKDRGGSGYVVEHMKKPLGNFQDLGFWSIIKYGWKIFPSFTNEL